MPDQAVMDLMRQAPFSFLGTVERMGAATTTDVPIDDRTAVVRVDQVLHAPQAFSHLAGDLVTLQLSSNTDPPPAGQSTAFFANGVAFGDSIVLAEVGRLPVGDIQEHLARAAAPGGPAPFADLQRQIDTENLREHAAQGDALVVGRVMGLQKAAVGDGLSEHDPDWWCATIEVQHVERGNLAPGNVTVLFPNSHDVRWRAAPKPQAGQNGVWILHATEGNLRAAAPFQIVHADDYQPVQQLDSLRAQGS